MHVLWLASWYPSKTDPFLGDFIRRHALAVSARCKVTVLHAVKAAEDQVEITGSDGEAAGLSERVLYYARPATPFSVLNRLLSGFRAFRRYTRAIRDHLKEHGRPPFIHVHVCMNAGLAALWAKRVYKIPYIVTEHFTLYIPGSADDYSGRPFLYRYLNKRILSQAAGVHNVSRFLQGCQEAITPLNRPVIIPNAVDPAHFHLPGRRREQAASFRFIHVSSFVAAKNLEGLLEGFSLLAKKRTDWELRLIGPLDARRPAEPSGCFRWLGELPYEQVGAHMREADALVHFSHYENQPCVISEALCCGLPVISSAVGGIPEALSAGNGILVPEGTPAALAHSLDRMIDEYSRFDRPGIADGAGKRYTYAQVGDAFMRYYASLGAVL